MNVEAPKEIRIKGNELGWLIKLMEQGSRDKNFQKSIEDFPAVQDVVSKLLGMFHPNNFNHGTSRDVWVLKNVK